MCVAFRRMKVFSIAVFIIVSLLILQHWTDTKATWKNTVMMKLREYQIELQQTIDFSNFEQAMSKNKSYNNIGKTVVNQVQSNLPVNVNKLLQNAKMCLRRSRNQISMYLMRTFELEFSSDHNILTVDNPILTPHCLPKVDLVIMLTTRPGAFYNRAAIRNAWGRMESHINQFVLGDQEPFTYRTIFTVGRDRDHKIERLVADEHAHYGDILRLNYADRYENLTNKTVLSLEWFANNCVPNYLLKTDDDCFVNLLSMIPWLQKLSSSVKYAGKKNDFMPVIRDPAHRNYVPMHEYAEEYYKPYCSGGGYMISGDILKNLTDKAKTINQIINEDAYIGLVMHALGVEPTDDDRFLPFVFTKKGVNKRTMCNWRDKFLMHGVEPEKQINMHWTRLAMRDYPSICENNVHTSSA